MIKFVQEVIRRIQDDDVPALGAQLTFYLILSFFPFLIFLLTLVSYTPLAREEIFTICFNFCLLKPTNSFWTSRMKRSKIAARRYYRSG